VVFRLPRRSWSFSSTGSRIRAWDAPSGRSREDEAAARAMGVNAVYYKVYAFSLGAFLAGYAGALYAHL